MDYQYKSICRGEHSIFGQIEKEGVDPRKYVFLFNLRSYDRLNKTGDVKRQEEESGVRYRDVQRAHAEEVMGEGVHGSVDDVEGGRDRHMGKGREQRPQGRRREEEEEGGNGKGGLRDKLKRLSLGGKMKEKEKREQEENVEEERRPDGVLHDTDVKRRYEAVKDGHEQGESQEIADQEGATIAHHAMAGPGSVTEVPWAGDDEDEVNHWIQEELYIHAKLLIVDDRIVVCGSSNLNDRSQLGYHDSELSIVMEDKRKVESTMDGEPFEAGWHAATLRRYLWREHLGLLPPQDHDAEGDPNAQPPGDDSPNDVRDGDESWKMVEDPLSDDLWEMWTERATTNTLVFRQLFHADPDDHGECLFCLVVGTKD